MRSVSPHYPKLRFQFSIQTKVNFSGASILGCSGDCPSVCGAVVACDFLLSADNLVLNQSTGTVSWGCLGLLNSAGSKFSVSVVSYIRQVAAVFRS